MNSENRTKLDTIIRILMNSYYWMLSVSIMNFLMVYWCTLYRMKEITIYHIMIYLFLCISFFVLWYIVWMKIHNKIFKNNFRFWKKNISYFLFIVITWIIFLTFNWSIFVEYDILIRENLKFPIFLCFYYDYYILPRFIYFLWIHPLSILILILLNLRIYISEKEHNKNIETQNITKKLIIFYVSSIIIPILILLFNLF